MPKQLGSDLDVTGNTIIRGDLRVLGDIYSYSSVASSVVNYSIELVGVSQNSGWNNHNNIYLNINGTSTNMRADNYLNTVILHPDGTVKMQSTSGMGWYDWEQFINQNAGDGDVVATASGRYLGNLDQNNGYDLLTSIGAEQALAHNQSNNWYNTAYALLFIKGESGTVQEVLQTNGQTAQLTTTYHDLIDASNKLELGRIGEAGRVAGIRDIRIRYIHEDEQAGWTRLPWQIRARGQHNHHEDWCYLEVRR